MRRTVSVLGTIILSVTCLGAERVAAQAAGPFVSEPVVPGSSPPVRDLPIARLPAPGDPIREFPRQQPPIPAPLRDVDAGQQVSDGALQTYYGPARAPTAGGVTFDGIAQGDPGTGGVPPDPIGDVGPNHYVQMVNVAFSIFSKTGTVLTGPTAINSLWAGQGNACETAASGDPVVVYDALADRWFLSQFRVPAGGPFSLCFAVSQTADPTGAYHLYQFDVPAFPDYYKVGVWPDAYYVGSNETPTGVFAFDRARMLAGQLATFQKFTPAAAGIHSLLLPSDLDGVAPPAGAPNYFYRFVDGETGGGVDRLEIFEFRVDFATPANSTFTGPTALPTAAFSPLCGFNRDCIPQPGTGQRLDSITEWPMWRFQYRNFGTHETLVANHSVDASGSDRAGIRWYELRKTGGGAWSIFQQGTHSPDTAHRWMGSIAMDKAGNMALGYSISDPAGVFPSLRYTGRLAGDALGTMQAEATLVAGGGSQTAFNRWGDYSSLNVDPVDGCTFWYTGEYYAATSAANWRTRIGTFSFPECGGTDADGDMLPDAWETQFGLDPNDGTGDNGKNGDPDGDTLTNVQELANGTHPRGFFTRFFAEGATGGALTFDTQVATANPGTAAAKVLYRFQKTDGTTVSQFIDLGAMTRHTLDVKSVSGLATAEFSTVCESDVQVVSDRTMTWDDNFYGSHAETSIPAAALTWHLAEGSTNGFNLFYLVQNPNTTAANITVTFLRPGGLAPINKVYTVPAASRFNIWVNQQDAALASADVSGVVVSTNGVTIIVERAMYLDLTGQTFGAGHESAGVTTPSTSWFFAEGATGGFFDLFVLLSNPTGTNATVRADYLLPSGTVVTKLYTVLANSRFNIWVDLEDAQLADTAVSTTITVTNGVGIIAERAMWWVATSTPGSWFEAHNSPGSTVTGTQWALAEGEVGGARSFSTFILIANTSAFAGSATVKLMFEDGSSLTRTFALSANSRFNVDVGTEFPGAAGRRFGAVITSVSTGGGVPLIVVERAMYSNALGVVWAAGTNALATRLQP